MKVQYKVTKIIKRPIRNQRNYKKSNPKSHNPQKHIRPEILTLSKKYPESQRSKKTKSQTSQTNSALAET